jgi:hypothetical protein
MHFGDFFAKTCKKTLNIGLILVRVPELVAE